MRKQTTAFLAVAVVSGLMFVYQGLKARERSRRKREMLDEYVNKGFVCMRDKMYGEAIVCYLRCLELLERKDNAAVSVYNNLAMCFVRIKAYNEALVYANKSLGLNVLNNERALRLKYECHKVLGMKRQALYDVFVCGLVTKEERYRKQAQEMLRNEADVEVKRRMGSFEGRVSRIVYEGLFSTFPDLFGSGSLVSDEVIELVRKGRYEDAIAMAEDRSDPLSKFVAALAKYAEGKDAAAISLLEEEKMIYSVGLREYLKAVHGRVPMDIDDFVSQNSRSVGVLFYAAKTYLHMKDNERYERLISQAMCVCDYDFLYVDRIVYEVGRGRNEAAGSAVEEGLRRHCSSILILTIGCEFYLKNEDFEKTADILTEMESSHGADPRTFLLKGVVLQAQGRIDEAEKSFRTAIQLDERYFKPYVYLGGVLLSRNDKNSKAVYEAGLRYAVRYEEMLVVQQALILIEAQENVMQMYPEVKEVT
ncbi:hypothetical protein HK407_10g15880 [Ordospora pajunii]|uniref:uncharacterized protein n=1 Tax=Ordospora pajunii TaxID=3039483 RepID=UPI0029527E9E|nr:uncharacterized protein HK407_10g15880 [Ordospora pajunii]KAH9410822.1 hypothetical protein HK407_10g15880 [Ordospora pajunii]